MFLFQDFLLSYNNLNFRMAWKKRLPAMSEQQINNFNSWKRGELIKKYWQKFNLCFAGGKPFYSSAFQRRHKLII